MMLSYEPGQLRDLLVSLERASDECPISQVPDVPATAAARARRLRELNGHTLLSLSVEVKGWLIGAGWSHRGLPGVDVYWQGR